MMMVDDMPVAVMVMMNLPLNLMLMMTPILRLSPVKLHTRPHRQKRFVPLLPVQGLLLLVRSLPVPVSLVECLVPVPVAAVASRHVPKRGVDMQPLQNQTVERATPHRGRWWRGSP